MKRSWQILSLLLLVLWLMAIKIPSVSSQQAAYQSSQIKSKAQLVLSQRRAEEKWQTASRDKSPWSADPIEMLAPENPSSKNNAEITQQQVIKNSEYVPVVVEGETLFSYSSKIEGFSAQDRAQQTVQKIVKVAKNSAIALNDVKIIEQEGLRIIMAEEESLVTLLKADAEIANLPLNELAEQYLQRIKFGIAEYRQQHNSNSFLLSLLSAAIELIIAIAILFAFQKVWRRIKRQICSWRDSILQPLEIQSLQLLSVEQEASLLIGLVKQIYRGIIAIVIFLYLSSLTRYFPWTKGVGQAIFDYLYSSTIKAIEAAIAYLPSLLTIIVTLTAAYYAIRFCRLFFQAIKREILSLPKFDREWAEPTEKLAMFLISAFAAAIVFPLLPGSQSPAFRGISIFAGALLTIGGASAIANLVGGIVIIYTRAFQTGDCVQIDGVKGNILEKTILSTRIRTAKNKIVTIPNANLLSKNIENYTTSIRDIDRHIILHTTVTLGYDIPWRKVHQILIEAARLCPLILTEPAPFILQTSLGDFSVSYELNAYTDRPSIASEIHSQLHQNIQDKCNEAGVEILSPQYSAIRDGSQNTIPKDYLQQDYTIPGFDLHPLARLFNRPDTQQDHRSSPERG